MLRPKDRPPAEELLLALAYLAAKKPGEAAKWHDKATQWLDRYPKPPQVKPAPGAPPNDPLAAIRELYQPPADPRYNAFDWETWYECDVFRAEVEAKLGKK